MISEKLKSIHPCCGFNLERAVAIIGGIKSVSALVMVIIGLSQRGGGGGITTIFPITVGILHIINDFTSIGGAIRKSLIVIKSCCLSYVLLFFLSIIASIMEIHEARKMKITQAIVIILAIFDIILGLYSFWVMYACINDMRGGSKDHGTSDRQKPSETPEVIPRPPPAEEIVPHNPTQNEYKV